MSKSTPGPWNVEYVNVVDINGEHLHTNYEINTHPDESKANAHLIACAPEMLEMLKVLNEALSLQAEFATASTECKIKALINKAEGNNYE